jgi:hypothetical protein
MRILLAVILSVGTTAASSWATPHDLDALMRHYDATDVAQGRLEVRTSGDLVYVRGTSKGTPWLNIWRTTNGEWKLVAEMVATELAPIRFGAKRGRSCRTS